MGLIREGGLLLTQGNFFIQMFFCIPSSIVSFKKSKIGTLVSYYVFISIIRVN